MDYKTMCYLKMKKKKDYLEFRFLKGLINSGTSFRHTCENT